MIIDIYIIFFLISCILIGYYSLDINSYGFGVKEIVVISLTVLINIAFLIGIYISHSDLDSIDKNNFKTAIDSAVEKTIQNNFNDSNINLESKIYREIDSLKLNINSENFDKEKVIIEIANSDEGKKITYKYKIERNYFIFKYKSDNFEEKTIKTKEIDGEVIIE